MGNWIDIYSDSEARIFIGEACPWNVFLAIHDHLDEVVPGSDVLSADYYFQYKLSIAEEWKSVDIQSCSTKTLQALSAIFVSLSNDHADAGVRHTASQVAAKIDGALAIILARRQDLSPRAQLFLLLEDRAIEQARRLGAERILRKEPINPVAYMMKQGWPGRGDFFFYSLRRKRPYWIR